METEIGTEIEEQIEKDIANETEIDRIRYR